MDSDRIEQVYTELFSMGIELDSDPTISGPRYLNEVVARCRNYMNRVTMILLELQRENRTLSRAVAGLKLEFKIEFDQLIAENEAIKRLPNIKDRESTANMMLAAKRRAISDLELQISDLDTIEKTVRLRHQELVRTSDNIKTQRSLLQTDRITGAGYGDESRGDSRDAIASSIDEGELDRLLHELSPGAAPASIAPEVTPEALVRDPSTPEAPLPTPEAPLPTPEAPLPTPEAPLPTPLEPADSALAASKVTEDFELARFLDEAGDPPNLVVTSKEMTTSSKAKGPKPTGKEVTKPNIDDFADFDFAEILSNL